MRTTTYICVSLLAAGLMARAQESGADRVNVPLSDPSRPAVVHASLMNGGITVTGYNGKEVIVEARPRHESARESKPDRKAEGMHRLDATGSGLTVEEQDNEVHVGVRTMNRTVDLHIQVPFTTSLKLRCLNDGDIKVEHVSGEVDADDLNGGVKLLNISGAVVAHSLNEDVVVTLDQVTPGKSMSFSTMNGDVDVTLPADVKARVKMKSDNGEIYSDFDVHPEANPGGLKTNENHNKDGRFRVQFDKVTYGSLNGGGPEMQFTTFNGKIYLRKKK
ncbi:MAG TPA: DUF4097 family beta strand repeat-containing protein [Bryobacteraceae bacterium]|nr:DUF4097 family beta strand repeat-containing protein [Bryobacteraceae bacterium]